MLASEFPLNIFTGWIEANNGLVLSPTNQWEVIRYRLGDRTHIIYKNAKDKLTFTGDSLLHWQASHKPKLVVGGGGLTASARAKALNALLQRDGPQCIYCTVELFLDDSPPATIEHLVPRSKHGTNHMSNLALACQSCNERAGDLDLADKIKLFFHPNWQVWNE